ncbi:hypothetical protein CVU82_02560 [Candidatus Falkowbacteria bacterium HGW-Falkowbacteria-1]|jgi:hypothetical protein|uniref:Uncharacterized protein n=1 Tax=Candidatus Falkowbacteria bacterium HGW-Falkowbacteria-1 TaxID=2013768 RepID=A0A2N2E9N7_9BACT|nr:MAG: hypothetical protein CVU82_02560 [Candidatus Falkowbacteria bacterium HGW-Falkowbacteria-1]
MENKKISQKEIEEKKGKIQQIYNNYIEKIKKLRSKQENIVLVYIKNKEKEKLEKIRQNIKK